MSEPPFSLEFFFALLLFEDASAAQCNRIPFT